MYLVPLNYDRYFKKVFSDTRISKRFLEDFLDVTIETIELLTMNHKITDDSVGVEFDFRCKIDDQIVIIDMQQWFKPDIVHRFYAYHCISTALQLEKLPVKSFKLEEEKEKKVKDYSDIHPVITIVWMVDDTFGFKDDFVSYTMTPELVVNLLKDNLLWQNKDITELLRQRERALSVLSNKTKKLDFLQKNRLIYIFQKNIVANSQKPDSKFHRYSDWFELAEKTRNKSNEKSDFSEYAKDEIFSELIRRIDKSTLTQEDFSYIDDYEKFNERVKRYDKGVYEDGKIDGVEIGKEIGVEKEKERRDTVLVKKCLDKGMPIEEIAEFTDLTIEEVTKIINKIQL